jgi:Glycosyltransferase
MKIVVVGTRGIPHIQGGIETRCEELYPRLVKLGYDVTVVRRSPYVSSLNKISEYKGVKLHDIYVPKKKSIEAILHTFLSICYAKRVHADILHIHAVGPSLLVPFARLLGLKVVMTHHGPDYDRKKWGNFAKLVLKMGERIGVRYSNQVIVISEVINNILKTKYNYNRAYIIYNGVNIAQKSSQKDYIESLGIEDGKYIFTLGRFVQEKGFDGLIKSFLKANIAGYKLVIAGDADHEDEYSLKLKQLATEHNIVLTGFIKGEKLNQLFTNARLFILPSFHEGLPISLLEAMSYNLDVLVSDIPANIEIKLHKNDYFKCGNWDDLCSKLTQKLTTCAPSIQYNLKLYNWDHIAEQVKYVYQLIVK